MLDQAVDPKVALFEKLPFTFKDVNYDNIDCSNEMNKVDPCGNTDPNLEVVAEKNWDAEWLM